MTPRWPRSWTAPSPSSGDSTLRSTTPGSWPGSPRPPTAPALTGNPGSASDIASRHGVVGLTRTAALEYVKRGIRVNAVNPGLIDTQIARDVVNGDEHAYAELAKHVPIGRAGRPEEIASVVLWLCSPGASYVVGHALTVDGGMTVV